MKTYRPSSLPLVLAGPLLRRVELDFVSVWIATSHSCEITLLVANGRGVEPRSGAFQWEALPQHTMPFGAALHIAVITLDLRSDGNATKSAGLLEENHDYTYDLHLLPVGSAPEAARSIVDWLAAKGDSLGYGQALPYFRTCPAAQDELTLIHGSCRRIFDAPPLGDTPADDPKTAWQTGQNFVGNFPPPGGWPSRKPKAGESASPTNGEEFPDNEYPTTPKRDGLVWVDVLIERADRIPLARRPHQLLLTGDQIYADDVPDILLPVLNALGSVLVGEEWLAKNAIDEEASIPATLENFPAAFRKQLVLQRAGLTTSDGGSHLLSFGEFVAYYVLCWSPEVWEALWNESWYENFPNTLSMPDEWRDEFLASAPEGQGTDEGAQEHFTNLCNWYRKYYWNDAAFRWRMWRFKSQVGRVRRALANVPTYMLADDHEVTDDWYGTREWRDRVFTRPLGVQLIRNGLIAYAVMQAWGNDPRAWSAGVYLELRTAISGWASTDRPVLASTALLRLNALLGLPHRPSSAKLPTFRPEVSFSFSYEGLCHRLLFVDGRTCRRFSSRTGASGGIDWQGPSGTFADSPMAAALPQPDDNDSKLTVVVIGVPVLVPDSLELVLLPLQRLARILTSVDAEAWSYETETFEAMLWTLSRYKSVVVLSGDIHMGFSAGMDYWIKAAGTTTAHTARIVQLVASGFTQDWGKNAQAIARNALLHDILQSQTNALHPAERVGWGHPVDAGRRIDAANLLSGALHAHPSLRSRLDARAPVVPTRGWPAGSKELTESNWAWRMSLARDTRSDGGSNDEATPPTEDARWSATHLPTDLAHVDTPTWHCDANRRMVYGRVFAFGTNVGLISFPLINGRRCVRHVLYGELPYIEGSKAPSGVQPYIVHDHSLVPLAPESWKERPKVAGGDNWNVDPSDPSLALLIHWLPHLWKLASGAVGNLWPDRLSGLDVEAKRILVSQAAARLAKPFRREILAGLGPFSAKSPDELDALETDDVAALSDRVGRLDIDAEVEAVLSPDLARLMRLQEAGSDEAQLFDDALLLVCSPWVNRQIRSISLMAGLLASLRAPFTKQTPALAGVLEGLWDRWRNHTYIEHWRNIDNAPEWLFGLLILPPRAAVMAWELVKEILFGVVKDANPKETGKPQIISAELAVTVLGTILASFARRTGPLPVSGWESVDTPRDPGVRNGDVTPGIVARRMLSFLAYPSGTARHLEPSLRASIGLVPPQQSTWMGELFAAWRMPFKAQRALGAGIVVAIETVDSGELTIPWGQPGPGQRVGGGGLSDSAFKVAISGRTAFSPVAGFRIELSPGAGLNIILPGRQPLDGEIVLSLGDAGQIGFVMPDDKFLSEILPSDGLKIPFDARISWSVQHGWRFAGAGELADVDVGDAKPASRSAATVQSVLPRESLEASSELNIKIGPLTLRDRVFNLKFSRVDQGIAISANATTTAALALGPLRIAVAGLGVAANWTLSGTPATLLDLSRLNVEPARPTGIAVEIDAEVVDGGGTLQRLTRGDGADVWAGALSLRIADGPEISAWGLIAMGGSHWSLLAFVAETFNPAIELPARFKLKSLGGLIGIHRSTNIIALTAAAKEGPDRLTDLFLPSSASTKLTSLIPLADEYFPSKDSHHVVGLFASLEWSLGRGPVNAKVFVALLVQLGELEISVLGRLELGLPTIGKAYLIRVKAGFYGRYSRKGNFILVQGQIISGKLFGLVELHGGVGALIKWRQPREFVYSLGGFHSKYRRYRPRELPEPDRLQGKWELPGGWFWVEGSTYFTVTSTSVQAGLSGGIHVGTSWGHADGDVTLDFLVMWEPALYLEASISCRVSIVVFGTDVASASLSGELSGPSPWRIRGTVTYELLCVSASQSIDRQWGTEESVSSRRISAQKVLKAALSADSALSLTKQRRSRVRLGRASGLVIDSLDRLVLRQDELPLGMRIDKLDRNPLEDPGTWTVSIGKCNFQKLDDAVDIFSVKRYVAGTPKAKWYTDKVPCGLVVGSDKWQLPAEPPTSAEISTTEDMILDEVGKALARRSGQATPITATALRSSAPARHPSRKWSRHALTVKEVLP